MQNASSTEEFDRYQRVSSALGVADFSTRLIHYTSFATFEAVLTSQTLWFGRLCELTDRDEGNHFLDAVQEQISRIIVGEDIPGLGAILPSVCQAIKTGTFVSSWCEYFDLQPDGRLGMWREYGDHGAGVGLVIDSSQFIPSAITADRMGFPVMVGKVEYVPRNRAIDHANAYFSRLANVDFLRNSLMDKIVLANMLAIKAPLVKHDGFAEEEEIRFIFMPELLKLMGRPLAPGEIKTFNGRTHFAFPLKEYAAHTLDLRIGTLLRRIVIGPGADQKLRAARVRQMLDQRALSNVEVHECAIPYARGR